MADDRKSVLAGDLFLEPFDFVGAELDHVAGFYINQVVVMLLVGRLVSCPAIGKCMALKDAFLLQQIDRAIDRREGNAAINR